MEPESNLGRRYAPRLRFLVRLARRDARNERWLRRAIIGRLERLADACVEVAAEVGDPMGRVLAGCLRDEADAPLAENFFYLAAEECGPQSAALVETQIAALEILREDLCRKVGSDLSGRIRDRAERDLAATVNDLAGLYLFAGRVESAEALLEECLHRLTRLPGQTTWLRETLANSAVLLARTGRTHRAFEVAEDVLGSWEGTTEPETAADETDPEALVRRAESYSTLGAVLSEGNHHRKALRLSNLALQFLRRLDPSHRNRQPVMQAALSNQALAASELSDFGLALPAIQESLELARRLAAEEPERFEPSLADCLVLAAQIAFECGTRNDALELAEEAVERFELLERTWPGAFDDDRSHARTVLRMIRRDFDDE